MADGETILVGNDNGVSISTVKIESFGGSGMDYFEDFIIEYPTQALVRSLMDGDDIDTENAPTFREFDTLLQYAKRQTIPTVYIFKQGTWVMYYLVGNNYRRYRKGEFGLPSTIKISRSGWHKEPKRHHDAYYKGQKEKIREILQPPRQINVDIIEPE
jgi:hypothetical protein